MRFHALGIPHTATNTWHGGCAYTQKVRRLCAMLTSLGHEVIHYGNERSEVKCAEHVSVTTHDDLIRQYGVAPGRTCEYQYDLNDALYRKFYNETIYQVGKRKQPRDFLLCFWGLGHKPVADAHADLIVVEPGIGYGGAFARWKIFESYAMLHAYGGTDAVMHAGHIDWYSVVIPNYFDPDDFTFSRDKADYLLFLGRTNPCKGLSIAVEVAAAARLRLVVAGPGDKQDMPAGVAFVGFADWALRRELLAGARALIAPSQYVEPFHGVLIEAAFSGTPTITVDWGAATENVLHGVTGYRCRTFEHFLWAAHNVDLIAPDACHEWATGNFSTDRVRHQYAEYFQMLMDVYAGKGWYELRARDDLDWLKRMPPHEQLPHLPANPPRFRRSVSEVDA